MGLKISEIIPKKEISLDSLKNQRIAVDSSQMLYQFLSSIRQRDGTPLTNSQGKITSHLVGLSSRIPTLMIKGLKLVFVFDGEPPKLKFKEKEAREQRKQIAEKKLKEAQRQEDLESIQKYSKQVTRLEKSIIQDSKDLLSAFGLPIIQAPSEAEAQAAFMAEKKDVDYVASNDYDALVYGSPKLLLSLTLAQRKKLPSGLYVSVKPELIELKRVLKELELNKDQLLILAILIGTDYNRGGIKGIGPKNALRLVKKYKNFDKLFKELKPNFNWKEIYAVFKSMPIMKNYQLNWKNPDEEKIKKILVDKNDFSEERINKMLKKLLEYKKHKQQRKLGEF